LRETVLVTHAIVTQPRLNTSHNILLANKSSSSYTLHSLEKSNLSSYLAGLIESDGSIIVPGVNIKSYKPFFEIVFLARTHPRTPPHARTP
jgi:hypothetical protein